MTAAKQKRRPSRQTTPAEFDREFVIDTFAVPSAEHKARFERARRKRGRPREGEGTHIISVSVERSLLARSDKLAKDLGITRAKLIARGLRAVLAAEGQL
jgi:hypothetical protein